jgi:hypothetical protein
MKIILITLLSFSAFAGVLISKKSTGKKNKTKITKPTTSRAKINNNRSVVLKNHAIQAKVFTKANNYCEDYCFLIDMKITSGKKRFFVYDLKTDSILYQGLVTHGGGSGKDAEANTFCNIPNSGSTSLGKYKIGNEYSGKFGMAFKL